jgi:hypothetical protein
MTLDDAAHRLGQISGAPARDYSTFDFGRDRDSDAKSVIVRAEQAPQILTQFRQELSADLIAYIGTTRWLSDEAREGDNEIVVAHGTSQFDILRLARTNAVNHEMETEDLIKKLQEYDARHGIDIFHAEADTVEFTLTRMTEDLRAFCEDLYQFCPDIVDQGLGTVQSLEEEIRTCGQVYLWWD